MVKTDELDFILTAQETALILGVSIRRVLQLARDQRTLRYRRVHEKAIRYSLASVMDFLHNINTDTDSVRASSRTAPLAEGRVSPPALRRETIPSGGD